jgi:hypothetical protein
VLAGQEGDQAGSEARKNLHRIERAYLGQDVTDAQL